MTSEIQQAVREVNRIATTLHHVDLMQNALIGHLLPLLSAVGQQLACPECHNKDSEGFPTSAGINSPCSACRGKGTYKAWAEKKIIDLAAEVEREIGIIRDYEGVIKRAGEELSSRDKTIKGLAELGKKYANATECFDLFIENGFTIIPPMVQKMVKQIGNQIVALAAAEKVFPDQSELPQFNDIIGLLRE